MPVSKKHAIAERIQKKAHEMGKKMSHDEAYSVTRALANDRFYAEVFSQQSVEIPDEDIEKIVTEWLPD